MTTTTTASPVRTADRTKTSTVLVAGVVAIVAALVGNTVVAQVALAAGASEAFQPLTVGAYGFFTVIGVIAGLVGWLLVRRAANAAATLRWLIPTVLVLSLVPDVFLGFSDRAGVSWGAVVALMVMHVVVTVAAVTTFSRLLPVSRTNA
jgi:uncharacterized membrane protein HdeD (DUF308 family)